MIDNGIIQIEQNGAYSIDNTHKIYAKVSSSFIHPLVFLLNETGINIIFMANRLPKQLSLSEFNQTTICVNRNFDYASLIITRENQAIKIVEEITVFEGANFAKISFYIESKTSNTYFDWLQIPFQSRGFPIQHANSVAIVDITLQLLNQIIFTEGKLGKDIIMQQNPNSYMLIFNLGGRQSSETSFFVGLSQLSSNSDADKNDYLNSVIENNSITYREKRSGFPLTSFDYRNAVSKWNISYVVVRDPEYTSRFFADPLFIPVFKNANVTIFKTQHK